MNKETSEALTSIFSDAEVLDIDLSSWDKSISFIFLSDHYNSFYKNNSFHPSIVNVRFLHVTDLHFEFRHHFQNDLEDDKHFVWGVDQSKIGNVNEQYYAEFYQNDISPKVLIKFKKVVIEIIDEKYINTLNKEWRKQGKGLVRPSIFKIYDILKG